MGDPWGTDDFQGGGCLERENLIKMGQKNENRLNPKQIGKKSDFFSPEQV